MTHTPAVSYGVVSPILCCRASLPFLLVLAQEIQEFLHINRLRLNTDLGQHFLIVPEVLDGIVAISDLQPDDLVVEIGPGIGILTRELLKHVASVTAVEIDGRLIPLLKTFVKTASGAKGKLNALQGNALTVRLPETPYKIVANIPYHITSPLLRHLLLESAVRPTSMTLLIQREVAENICSETTESLLTLIVGLFGKAHFVQVVPKAAFLPPPAVESAVIFIDCTEPPAVDIPTAERVLSLAKHAMSKRRKMLSNSIGELPNGMELLAAAKIDPTRRPQTLTIEEWITLERCRNNQA
jgi:16S rRNA (adenine1518-N6/adenine1519-N6)-dimethyltransferase